MVRFEDRLPQLVVEFRPECVRVREAKRFEVPIQEQSLRSDDGNRRKLAWFACDRKTRHPFLWAGKQAVEPRDRPGFRPESFTGKADFL